MLQTSELPVLSMLPSFFADAHRCSRCCAGAKGAPTQLLSATGAAVAAVVHAAHSGCPHLHSLRHPELQVSCLEPCRTRLSSSSSMAAAGAPQVCLAKRRHACPQGPQTALLPWTHGCNIGLWVSPVGGETQQSSIAKTTSLYHR